MLSVLRRGSGVFLQQKIIHSLLLNCSAKANPQSVSIATTATDLVFKSQSSTDVQSIFSRLKRIFKLTGPIMNEEKPKIVFVLGGPGSGKGTQCQKIVERFGFQHLSAGDLLREERNRPSSEYGALIDSYIRNGRIVPVEVTCSLIAAAMKKSSGNLFLIDGFPRNQDNLDGWNREMSDKIDFQFVLFLDCPEETCIQRCISRGQGGSGRTDDNIESLTKRIQTYTNESLPIIQYFENLGKVRKVNACVPSADEVFNEVVKVFEDCGFH